MLLLLLKSNIKMKALAVILATVFIPNVYMIQYSKKPNDDSQESVPLSSNESYDEDLLSKGFYFLGEKGEIHVINEYETADDELISDYTRNANNTHYYLYTRSNPSKPQRLFPGSVKSVRQSHYDVEKVTIFVVHGWKGSYTSEVNTILRKAFLSDDNVNVICVDWSYVAKSLLYKTAKEATPKAGVIVGEFIRWMFTENLINYDSLHLVGFSLGAHLVGSAGRHNYGQIARITGLDPAGPSWISDNRRLNRRDAEYVEVIHTNTMLWTRRPTKTWTGLGFKEPLGHADFYPNGGHTQPGCNKWILKNAGCAHRYSIHLMDSSIKHDKFKADHCTDLEAAQDGLCFGPAGYMGNTELNKPIRGIYRLNTKKDYPYHA